MPDFRKPSIRTRASTSTTSIEEHVHRHVQPAETPLNVDTFAEALDRLAKGDQVYNITDPDLAALVDSGKHVQLDGGSGDTESRMRRQTPGIYLSQEQKQSIWEDVMRSQQEVRPLAGISRSVTSVVNPRSFPAEQVSMGPASANRPLPAAWQRPSPMGRFRARIDIQPVVTALLVAALIVAIVAGYRGFGGGSGSLVTPTASAHGNPELAAAIGSPESSPATAFACDVSGTPVANTSTSQSDSYGYAKRGPISEAQAEAIPDLMGRFIGCLMKGPNYRGLEAVATSRFVTDLQQEVAGTPEDAGAFQRRKYALTQAWSGPLPLNSLPLHATWKTSNGTPENLNLFLDTAQRLDDGRIGMLASIAPQDVSPVPDEMWVSDSEANAFAVSFIGIQETDEGLRIDDMFGLCGGSECVPLFGANAVTPQASPSGSPVASPVASAFACDVSGTPVAQDTTSQSDSYGYQKRGPISETQAAAIPGLMGPLAECMYERNYQGLMSVSTSRYVADLQQAASGTPVDLAAIQRRSSALDKVWSGPLPTGSQPVHVVWKTSNGTIENFNLFLDTAQRLDDGRIGMLATVAPVDVSPVPDERWVARNDTAMLSVWFIGFEETDEGLRVDEMFGMCGGSQCVPIFGANVATPEASPEASPVASPISSPVVRP